MKLFIRIAIVVVVSFLISCGGLNDEQLKKIARSSPNAGALLERLASETGGEMLTYNKFQFALKMDRKAVKPEKFRPILKHACASSYRGELQVINKNDLLVGKNVPAERLSQLSGRKGPVTRYLGVALGRSMRGYVVDKNREIERLVIDQDRKIDNLVVLSKGICTSYRQGILAIHFVALLLSEDPMKGSAPLFWAVTEGGAFTASLNKEIDRARTAAQRTMFLEKDTVDHYIGSGVDNDVHITIKMIKKMGFVDTYRTIFTVTNDSDHNYLFSSSNARGLRSASGMDYSLKLKKPLKDKSSCDFDRVTKDYNIPSGRECTVDLVAEISYFTMPDELLSFKKGNVVLDMKPVSVYEKKYESR